MSVPRDVIAAAVRLKNDLAFQHAIQYLQQRAYAEFMSSDPAANASREAIYHRVSALEDIQATLRNIAQEADKGEDSDEE